MFETDKSKNNGYGNVQSLNANAIMEYSSCTIECTAAETASTNPNFWFSLTVPAAGAFGKFNGGNTRVLGNKIHKVTLNQTKELMLNISNGNESIDVVLNPQLIYANKTENMGTAEDTGKEELGPDWKTHQEGSAG